MSLARSPVAAASLRRYGLPPSGGAAAGAVLAGGTLGLAHLVHARPAEALVACTLVLMGALLAWRLGDAWLSVEVAGSALTGPAPGLPAAGRVTVRVDRLDRPRSAWRPRAARLYVHWDLWTTDGTCVRLYGVWLGRRQCREILQRLGLPAP
jgi:hypothetical protein